MITQQIIRRLAVSMLLVMAAPPTVAQRPPSEHPLATVTTHIEALVVPQAEAEFLSGVILIARGNQILFHRAYGFANWELYTPNSRLTRFGVGSITKTMTQTLVDVLVKTSRIDLDAPVEKYLKGFPKGPSLA